MAIRRTNRGTPIDIDALLASNQNVMAIGNMRVNAAGDLLGPHGEIIQKNEDRVRAYYKNNPKSSTAKASLKGKLPESNEQEIAAAAEAASAVKTAKTQQENTRTAKPKRASAPAAEPDLTQPSEFDVPEETGEPLGFKEVELPNGDIEMVPVYKQSDL